MRTTLTFLMLVAYAMPAGAQVGLDIISSDFGVRITTTGSDAIRIRGSGDDGIQIGEDSAYPNYGVYIPSPGVPGYGLWPNTAEPGGEWALFTVDNIEAGNVALAGVSLIARVGEAGALEAGDVVAATGIAEPDERYPSRVATVQRAGEDSPGVVGVVQSRMAWVTGPQKDGESALESVPGTAGPGDYVRLAVLGVASVRVQPGATIRAGERLTPGGFAGEARPLRVRRIDGFTVAEATPVVGTALESSDGSRAEILAFVSTR